MSYHFRLDEEPSPTLRRLAHHQADKALAIVGGSIDDPDIAIHEVRKRCKKLRALLRLVRPGMEDTYKRENAALRDAARRVAELRDAKAHLETLRELGNAKDLELNAEFFGALYEFLKSNLALTHMEQDSKKKLISVRNDLEDVKDRVEEWSVQPDTIDTAFKGFKKTYKRGRKAFRAAYKSPSPERFHEWRKRVKYHRFHVRLLREAWPEEMRARDKSLKALSGYLGEHHDLEVLRNAFAERDLPGTISKACDTLRAITHKRSRELERVAHPLGQRLFTEAPSALRRRVGVYWDAARDMEP